MNALQDLTISLPQFFSNLERVLAQNKDQYDLSNLENFFENLHKLLPAKVPLTNSNTYQHLSNLSTFKCWIESLAIPLSIAKREGYFCDPWEISGIKRDEVRNSRVLAWLLDPRGSHGFGNLFLRTLLANLRQNSSEFEFPMEPTVGCQVRTEKFFDRVERSRFDIEVDDQNFYLVIEVKIDANEGKDQLKRYGDVAKSRVLDRPWIIIFLTKDGSNSITAHNHEEKVIPISWKNLSLLFYKELRIYTKTVNNLHKNITYTLTKSFLKHIQRF